MGRPLVDGSDKRIAYPIVDRLIGYCANIHPNYLTLLGIFFKIVSVKLMYTNYYFTMFGARFVERILDCLDGEVARHYDKGTKFGHFLDKFSDMVCNVFTILIGLHVGILNCSNYTKMLIHIMLYLIAPIVYIYDIYSGREPINLSVTKDMSFIHIEDNSILLSLIIPLELCYFVNK